MERILALGGSVRYDYECDDRGLVLQPQQPRWEALRSWIGHGYFEHVVRISLDDSAVTDADMEVIGKLRGVRTLSLNDTAVSDMSLEQIQSWRQLNYLGLMRTNVTSEGMRYLEEMQSLDTLILESTNVGDEGAASIAKLRRLGMLNMGGTQVTSAAIPRLSNLSLGMLGLSQTVVDDAAISDLCEMKYLNWLLLNGSQVSGEGLWRFRQALPECDLDADFVDLTGWPPGDVPDGAWTAILKRLEPLDQEGRLKLIDVSGVDIADRHLDQLKGFTNLQMLDLRETRVTDAGVESLRQSLPGCKIAR